jgi:hypothetical protein
MLKPLTLSLSLAVALGLCGVSKAGGHDSNCTTCGLASPQGVVASAQGTGYGYGCETPCCPPKHHFSFHLPKIHHSCSYEWVLKKKHCWSIQHGSCGDGCGGYGGHGYGGGGVYATGQAWPSGQGVAGPSGQYAAPQVYGAGQRAFVPGRSTTSIAAVPSEMTPATSGGEEVPPAPGVKETSANGPQGGLLLPTPSGN